MVHMLYTLLGRREEIAAEAAALGICIKNRRLALKSEHKDVSRKRIKGVLMALHHIIVQNDGRWITHGVSGQLFAGSLMAGLEEAVKNACEAGDNYSLGPFRRRNNESLRTLHDLAVRKLFCCVRLSDMHASFAASFTTASISRTCIFAACPFPFAVTVITFLSLMPLSSLTRFAISSTVSFTWSVSTTNLRA